MSQSARVDRRPWPALVLLCAAQFMVVLDITIANVALPSIGASLGFAASDLPWVVTAYVLMSGGLLLVGARAADLLGRRRVFLAGLLLFTAASLASGLAPSPAALVAARVGQGLGAALLTPAALAIVTTAYAGRQRTVALSAWAAIGSSGAAAGVVIGGLLTTVAGWEWVFLVNAPLGLAVAALTPRLVPSAPAPSGTGRLDLLGAVSAVGGLMVLVYAITRAAEHGWDSPRTLVLLALAAGLLGAFAALERVVAQPLVPPSAWRARSLVAGSAEMLGVTGILAGAFFLNSLYLQRALGWSALESGLAFLPLVAAIALGVHVAAHLLPRAGSRGLTVAGLALAAVGALLLAVAPDRAGYATDVLPGLLALGAGVGLVFPAASVGAMRDVDEDGAGVASGLMTTAHEIGAALGIAVLSAVASTVGAGAPAGRALAEGYGRGFAAVALTALALAVLAALAVPAARPSGDARLAPH
jgi:EmrB/QacA subfamily drug resistance transporter